MSTPSLDTVNASDGLPPAQRHRAVLVILLGLVLVVLDVSVVTLALPRIASAFGVSPAAAVWVVTGYQLAVLSLLLPMASLGERIGYHRVYLAGMVVFGIASLCSALSQSLWQLVVCRIAQGAAGAAVMGVNAALVRQAYPSALLGRGIALNALTVAVASVAGPSIAAVILSMASWPWLFGVNVPLAVLIVALGLRALPKSERLPHAPLAWLDVALNIAAFALLFWAVDRLATHGFAAWQLTESGLLSACVLLLALALWIWYLRRQWLLPEPLLPLDLLRIPVFALSMCASVMAFCAQMLTFIALPFLTLSIFHYPPLQAGLLISVWPISIVAIVPVAGRLTGRVSGGLLGGIGMAAMAAGLACLAALPLYAPFWAMAAALALCGLGFGLFQTPNNHTILTSAPRSRSGAAGGMLGTARLTGQSLGAALAAGVFALWPPPQALNGPAMAFGLAALAAVAAALASVLRVKKSVAAPSSSSGSSALP